MIPPRSKPTTAPSVMATHPPMGTATRPSVDWIQTANPMPQALTTQAAAATTGPGRRLIDSITSATTRANSTPVKYGMTPVKGYSPRIHPPNAAAATPSAMPTTNRALVASAAVLLAVPVPAAVAVADLSVGGWSGATADAVGSRGSGSVVGSCPVVGSA